MRPLTLPSLLGALVLFGIGGLSGVSAQAAPGPGLPGSGTVFRFQYTPGDQYRMVGENRQRVFLNGELLQNVVSRARATFRVSRTEGGSGFIESTFQFLETHETPEGQPGFQLTEEYPSSFWRDERGRFRIDASVLMPVVRHVPTFPAEPLRPGDTWIAPGEEVHDMRRNFQQTRPVRGPIEVRYLYVGPEEKEGRPLHKFRIQYTLRTRTGYTPSLGRQVPLVLSGTSDQTLWFDQEAGQPHSYEETYSLFLQLSGGSTLEFTGSADSRLVPAESLDRAGVAGAVRRSLDERGLTNVEIRQGQQGVTLNLDAIGFVPDQAQMLPGEEEKLRLIGEILRQYPDRDILVEGHTALAGTEESRQRLSEDRARTVLEALVAQNVRPRDRILYRGWGARRPLADNLTELGRQKNRRVEITILEN